MACTDPGRRTLWSILAPFGLRLLMARQPGFRAWVLWEVDGYERQAGPIIDSSHEYG